VRIEATSYVADGFCGRRCHGMAILYTWLIIENFGGSVCLQQAEPTKIFLALRDMIPVCVPGRRICINHSVLLLV